MGKMTAKTRQYMDVLPQPKRCMLRFYISALIFVLIIAITGAPSLEEMRQEAMSMHNLLKAKDKDTGGVFSIINSDALKEKYKIKKQSVKEQLIKNGGGKEPNHVNNPTEDPEETIQKATERGRANRAIMMPEGMPEEIFLPDDID